MTDTIDPTKVMYDNRFIVTCECGLQHQISAQASREHINSEEHAARMAVLRTNPEWVARKLRDLGVS